MMKRFLLLMTLSFAMTTISTATSSSLDYLRGFWYDSYTGAEIKIKTGRNHIKVRGLHRRNKWRRYDADRFGEFRDCDGNSIILHRNSSLRYIPRRRGVERIFYRNEPRARRGNDNCGPTSQFRNNNRRYESYYVHILNEYIDIRFSRGEISARRQGGTWVRYIQNPYRKNEYVDRRGNTYVRDRRGNLRWTRNDGNVDLYLERS